MNKKKKRIMLCNYTPSRNCRVRVLRQKGAPDQFVWECRAGENNNFEVSKIFDEDHVKVKMTCPFDLMRGKPQLETLWKNLHPDEKTSVLDQFAEKDISVKFLNPDLLWKDENAVLFLTR